MGHDALPHNYASDFAVSVCTISRSVPRSAIKEGGVSCIGQFLCQSNNNLAQIGRTFCNENNGDGFNIQYSILSK